MAIVLAALLVVCQCGALAQDEADEEYYEQQEQNRVAQISVSVTQNGNAAILIATAGLGQESGRTLEPQIPAALGCRWRTERAFGSFVMGKCSAWLIPPPGGNSAPVRLADLVRVLRDNGAEHVEVHLSYYGKQSIQPAPGWTKDEKRGDSLHFQSKQAAELPPPIEVAVDGPPTAARILVPILVVTFVPGLLAYIVRMRSLGASATRKLNWLVWLQWINLASWLYWITVVRPGDLLTLLELAGFSHWLFMLVAGVVLLAAPPLLSLAAAFTAMAPLLSSSDESFVVLFQRQMVSEAHFIVPLSVFLVATESGSVVGFGGIIAAYVVYRVLRYWAWNLSYGETIAVNSGELYERASALARKAGFKFSQLGILRTRVPEEANAFASSDEKVVLTESLVRGLPQREIDAVLAHEIGHHTAGHLRLPWPAILFWVYILFGGVAVGFLQRWLHLPEWVLAVPIAPLVFLVLQGFLSQRQEFQADQRAVQLTGDPEGKIAALGRLALLSRIPAGGGGFMGSIMSHPSMEGRVLALGRRFGISDGRALAVLANPDLAYETARAVEAAGAAAAAPMPQPTQNYEVPAARPEVLTQRRIMSFFEALSWIHVIAPLGLMLLVSSAFFLLAANPSVAKSLAGLTTAWKYSLFALWALAMLGVPLIADLAAERWHARRFAGQLRRELEQVVRIEAPAMFMGMHPGKGMRYTEAISAWDFGFVSLEGDWLCYRGHRARFAVPRQAILGVEVRQGPICWNRGRRVEVAFTGGAFTLEPDFGHTSWALAERVQRWLETWIAQAETPHPFGAPPEAAPALPDLPGMEAGRFMHLLMTGKMAVKLLVLGLGISVGASSLTHRAAAWSFVPFFGILYAILRYGSGIIWPIRRPDDASAPEQTAPVEVPASAGGPEAQ